MIRDGALYFLARIGTGLLAIVTLAIFTRLLTPAQYGLYALGVTVASIAAGLLFQWLTVSVGRFYPTYVARLTVLVTASERGFQSAALAAAACFLVALLFFRSEARVPLPFMGAVLVATVAVGRFNLFLQVANSQGSPRRYVLLSWLKSAAILLMGAGLVLLGGKEFGALAGFAVGHVVAVLACNPFGKARPMRSDEAGAVLVQLLRYGMPLVLTFLGTLAVDFSDRLLIAWLLGVERVGPYAAAYDLSTQSVGAITNVLFMAAFPSAVRAFEREGENEARAHLRSLGRSLIAVGLPAAVGFSMLSSDIASAFLGASFRREAVSVMPIVAVALWIGGYKSFYLDAVFQLRAVTAYQALLAVLMMVVNVLLNLAFLRAYGIRAAAWATLAALAAGALASSVLGRRYLRLQPLAADFARAFAACALMALSIVLLSGASGPAWLVAKVAVGGIVYLVAAWFLDLAEMRAWVLRVVVSPLRKV